MERRAGRTDRAPCVSGRSPSSRSRTDRNATLQYKRRMSEPEDDPQFARLLADWREELGPEKDEGIGLLWKEGGIEALSRRSARRGGTRRSRISRRGVHAISRGDDGSHASRARGSPEHDLAVPIRWRDALAMLEPPMPKRFRERIEAWLDRARGIERRCDGAMETPAIQGGSAVYHGRRRRQSAHSYAALAFFAVRG